MNNRNTRSKTNKLEAKSVETDDDEVTFVRYHKTKASATIANLTLVRRDNFNCKHRCKHNGKCGLYSAQQLLVMCIGVNVPLPEMCTKIADTFRDNVSIQLRVSRLWNAAEGLKICNMYKSLGDDTLLVDNWVPSRYYLLFGMTYNINVYVVEGYNQLNYRVVDSYYIDATYPSGFIFHSPSSFRFNALIRTDADDATFINELEKQLISTDKY